MPASAELRSAASVLATAGVASPRVDAELLLAHLLGRSRSRLLLVDQLSEAESAAFAELIRRRASGEPVQYLTGLAPFRRLELAVGAGVFIPRPETELILELAAAELTAASVVLDLCAGSGAIALSVAAEFGPSRVIAVERSEAALRWLRTNAEARADAGDRPIEVVEGDVSDPALLLELTGRVDVLLTNPPYVPERIRAELPVEVGHDPAEAVYAGPDGLSLMPTLFTAAARLLRPGGVLVLEHDPSQLAAVPALLAGPDWQDVTGHPDLTGRPRFTRASRR